MAYIVGIISKDDEAILLAQGYTLEPAPKELVPSEPEFDDDDKSRYKMIWVDASVLEVIELGW